MAKADRVQEEPGRAVAPTTTPDLAMKAVMPPKIDTRLLGGE
jgi:hypothetical protein